MEYRTSFCPPACRRLLFPSFTTEGCPGCNQVKKSELHSSFPSRRQGTSRREISAWAMGPATSAAWPLAVQDKGASTNKAVTSTLLFCCPNEPTGPGTRAAAIWDIQSSENTVSRPFSWLGYKQIPPSTEFQTFANFISMKSAGKCGKEMVPWGETTEGREPAVENSKRE